MKRLLGVFLLLSLVISPVFAESFNWEALSDEELLIISSEIDDELSKRAVSKERKLISGTYVVGKTIPAGSYIVYSPDTYGESVTEYVSVFVYRTEDDYENRKSFDRNTFSSLNKTPYFFYLEEGGVVYVSQNGGEVFFQLQY